MSVVRLLFALLRSAVVFSVDTLTFGRVGILYVVTVFRLKSGIWVRWRLANAFEHPNRNIPKEFK